MRFGVKKHGSDRQRSIRRRPSLYREREEVRGGRGEENQWVYGGGAEGVFLVSIYS